VKQYLDALPADRRAIADEVVSFVRKHLPRGYEEGIGWGAINWSVPLSVLPDTYNKQPLCYVAFAATKAGFSLYLMSVYGSPESAAKFKAAYEKSGKKLKMGKSCVNFRTVDDLALPAIKDAIKGTPMKKYVEFYRAARKATAKGK
jgi:hypothetical protein